MEIHGNVRVFQNNNNKGNRLVQVSMVTEGDSLEFFTISTTGENELLLAIGGSLNDGNLITVDMYVYSNLMNLTLL